LDNYFVFDHSILKTRTFTFEYGEYKIEKPGIYIVSYNQGGHHDNYICCFVLISPYKNENLIHTFLEPVYIFGNNTRPYAFKYYPYTGVLKLNIPNSSPRFSLIKISD